jgi:hypothetical protein
MARSRKELQKLAEEFAALSREERARVLALASRRESLRPPPANFQLPLLSGGAAWIGGTLRREDLYGTDGR